MATTNLSDYDVESVPTGSGLRFGIVVSEWNHDITENLYEGAFEALLKHEVDERDIIRLNVPGSFELVYGAKLLIETTDIDAVIVIGSVIRGETAHFDYVCSSVAQGVTDLNIAYHIPIIFGVLTDDNRRQAIDRSGGSKGNKGTECAIAAIKMASVAAVMYDDFEEAEVAK